MHYEVFTCPREIDEDERKGERAYHLVGWNAARCSANEAFQCVAGL